MAFNERSLFALTVGCSALVFSAVAAPDGPDDPALDTRPVLAGPDVSGDAHPAKLIERNLDGSMRPSEIPIAEKALELIDLDEATRSAVDVLLEERAALIDAIVKENLDTINAMRNGRKKGDRNARREHMRQMMELFRPVLKDGPLEMQIAELLPEAQREQYLGLIREHREMMRAERRARGPRGPRDPRGDKDGPGFAPGGPPDGPMLFDDEMPPPPPDADAPPPRGKGERGRPHDGRRGAGRDIAPGGPGAGPGGGPGMMLAQMHELGIEIRRSIERVTGERLDRIDMLTKVLDLTPEQQGKVREILRRGSEAVRNARDRRAARREMMQSLAAELSPEQREKLREFMGAERRRGGPTDRPNRPGRPSDRPTPTDNPDD